VPLKIPAHSGRQDALKCLLNSCTFWQTGRLEVSLKIPAHSGRQDALTFLLKFLYILADRTP
jgi:hypothetical protein